MGGNNDWKYLYEDLKVTISTTVSLREGEEEGEESGEEVVKREEGRCSGKIFVSIRKGWH